MAQIPDAGSEAGSRGIVGSVRRVVAHARALAQLERELAKKELQRKGGFGLATLAAVLALVVDWWLALLIVFLLVVLLVVVLALVARKLVRDASPLKPEQAIAEAELTKQALRRARAE